MGRAREFDEEEILRKAMVLFWTKGYHDTSISDLIEFLGISNASIYNSFGGKRKLYGKAFEYYQKVNFEGMTGFLSTQEDVRKGLRGVFEKIVQDDFEDEDCKGCFIVNTTTELLPGDEEIQEILKMNKVRNEEAFLRFLEQGVEKGQISEEKDIHTIARLLQTLMQGLRVQGKIKPSPKESLASVDAVLSLLD